MATRKKEPFLTDRIKSFRYALSGLKDILKTEHNAQIHFVMTLLVTGLAWWLQIDSSQWGFIILAIAGVWTTEALNTVLEILSDMVAPSYSIPVKRAKDMAAAAVLIAAISAGAIGLVVLLPPLIQRLGS